MKATLGLMRGTTFAAATIRPARSRVQCLSSSGHLSFIKDVAMKQPPEYPSHLLKMLQAKGNTIICPAARHGMIPLAIPLSKNSAG